MRQRIDDRAKKSSPIPLEKLFKEIVVGTGRAQEPYIIAFHYASDNVAGHGLGTLFGFFEVEIHDQDAAYIVNFLASVAKKEYFANPRRTPTDSFDAALHKINVALAEIVKHGNISWLGHLHGAIGAVNGNNLHFSATGDGELYLAREGSFQPISQGLADTESEPHPLKTFTEVSSGELFDGDLIIAFSPSVWSLFSPEDLTRSLNRLGPAGFEQFLRTAFINELPVAAAALLLCSAPIESPAVPTKEKETKKPSISLENVWSGKPFSEALDSKANTVSTIQTPPSLIKEEYTDKKTGHIYVQAPSHESFEAHPSRWQESWGVFTHHLDLHVRSTQVGLKKAYRRIGKETGFIATGLQSQIARFQRASGRRLRLGKRALQSKWQSFQERRRRQSLDVSVTQSSTLITQTAVPSTFVPKEKLSSGKPYFTLPGKSIHLHVKNIGQSVWEILRTKTLAGVEKFFFHTAAGFRRLFNLFQRLSLKGRFIFAGATVVIIGIAFFLSMRTTTDPSESTAITAEISLPVVPTEIFPAANEPLSILLSSNRLLFPTNNSRSLALATINSNLFLVTERAIVNMQTQESTTTPETVRLATAMDDLDSLFVLGESGTLYLYSVTTKKFEKNTLPLSDGASVTSLGTYLTYLYVLDQKAGTIYRFPRAEGGFGAATTWSKETLNVKEKAAMSVYENIILTDNVGKPVLYNRGKNTGTVFGNTASPVMADQLAFDSKTGDVFALDQDHKRIIRWSATGTLVNQYFHESFGDVESFTISSDGTEILTSSQGATSAWRI